MRINQCFLIQSSDLSHTFSTISNSPYNEWDKKTALSSVFLRKYKVIFLFSLLVYSDIIENNRVSDTKTPFQRCIPFIPKLKIRETKFSEK